MMFLVPLPVYLLSAVASPPAENMPDRAPGGAMVAQTIVPADDGTGTVVRPQGDRMQITGGSRSGDGVNLFHSFDRFNLDRGHTANFLSSPEIQNIFSRVTGGDASVINGMISVTGGGSNLFLINPAGILFGSDARLNVPGDFAAIAATGIGFGDRWLATIGDNNWAELVGEPSQFAFDLPHPGSIVNLGNLSVLPGGDVTLMGGTVLNAGTISAPGGRITLAAVPGESAIRISRSHHLLSLEIESAAAIARSVSGTLTALSLPQLLAGGGVGGATRAIANPDGTIAISGSGIAIDPQTGDAIASGTLDVSGDRGMDARAQVNVLGNRVAVLEGRIDASGATGGGEIRIGGDWRGSDALPRADRLVVDRESEIVANARYSGDGGRVILWSENQTHFGGSIRARGGDRGGNGGVVEVSGKEFLQFSGGVDTSAPAGSVGTLLLDPKNITIAAQGSDAIAPHDGFGEQIGTTATIAGADLAAAIDFASVTLQANNDIIIDDPITASTPGHGLTLQAGRSISFTQQGKITLAGGDFTAMINDASAIASDRDLGANPQFLMNPGSQIITNGGNITLSRGNLVGGNVGNVSLSGATLDSGIGNISIVGDAVTGHGIHLDNQTVVQSSDGTISLTGTGGASGTNLTSNYGIYIRNGSIVRSTGMGEIVLNGTGGSGTDFNYGIWIRGNNTRVSSTDGNLTLNGTSGGIGTDNHGVYLWNSQVESSGMGNVRLRGIGASGTNVNYGILVRGSDARVLVAEGNLDFLGTAMGSGTSNIGIYLDKGTVASSGSANLQFAGTGAGGAPGVRVRDGAIAAQSGAIALSGDEIDLEGTTEVRGQGRVQLQPLDPSLGISVGGTVSDGRLNLDERDIATLQPGFDQIVLGADMGSGAIALEGDVTVSDSIRLQSPNPGGEINTTGYTLSATGAIALDAAGDIATGPISTLQSSGAIAISSESGRIDTSGGTLDTSATGNAGNISLSAPGRVSVGNIDSTGLANSGNLEITSSEIDFNGTSVRGQGVIRLQTDDPSRDIAIGNNDNTSAALDLTATELQTLHPDWGEILIGQSDSTATITLHPFNFESPVSLLGGSTLIGSDRATDWTITNPDSGTLSGFQSTLSFTNIENLTGGTLSDSFIFTNTGRISGNLHGVDGTDTLDYSNANFDATINLATQSATGIGGTLSSVENFLGNPTASNTLIGANLENSWNLNDTHQGTVGNVSFSGIQTLQGGNQTDRFVLSPKATFSQINGGNGNNTLVAADTANLWEITATDRGTLNSSTNFSQIQNLTGGAVDDTFKWRNNARISGNLAGVGETDKLDYSSATFDVTVNLAQQSASGVGGTISSIESVVGNPLQSNTLMGDNSENNWTIGNFSGTVGGVNFSEFQTLRGGSEADNFSLAPDAKLSQIVGGDGNNTLVAADKANVWEILGVNSGMLNGEIAFSQIQNLTGGNVDDSFKFAGNGRIEGNLQGVAVTDILDYSNYNNDVTVNLAENRATGVGGQISSIESVVGNPLQNNEVVARNTTNIWTVTGTNRGRINGVSFEFVQNLTGGSLDDTFVFADGSRVTGLVDGGTGGYNTLDYSGYTDPVTVDIPGGTATATGGIVNIQAAIPPPPLSPEAPAESEADAPAEEPPAESEADAPDSGEGEGEAPEAIAPESVVSEEPAPEAIALPPLPSPEPAPEAIALPPLPSPEPAPATPAIPLPSEETAPATPAIPIPAEETAPPVPAPPVRDAVPEAQGEEVSPANSDNSAPAREIVETVATPEVPSTPEEIPVVRIPSPFIPDAGIPPMPAPGGVLAEEMAMSEGESPPRESLNSESLVVAENPVAIASLRRQIERLLDDRNLPEALRFIDLMFTEEYARYLNLVYARELQSFSQIQDKLRAIANITGTQPAIIYTFMRDEQLDLVLVPPQGVPIYKTVPEAKRDLIIEQLSQFRQDITNPLKRHRTDYLVLAQQFHDWIIAPLETDIQLQNIDTLMFSMDGGMRTLPVAALHDREGFLVEKYRVGLIPSVNLTDTRYESLENARVLAMGASEFTDKIALPAVPVELSAILKIWPGKSFLNEAFTFNNLKLQREKEPFRLVHLATHSEFNPGNPEESYIQLWDGRLSLDRVRELNWNSPPVELLVLSACRTAVGDENAELGFAGLAVNAGVKSALASLWYVNDEGTLGLMSEFYHQLHAVSVKAEALRRSQVAMIRGEIRVQQGELIYTGDRIPLPPPLSSVSYQELSHPYYWAGFTAIGSPW